MTATRAPGARRHERERHSSLQSSLLSFVAMTALVVGGAVALGLLLDPRTHDWWLVRWNDLAALVRALLGRS